MWDVEEIPNGDSLFYRVHLNDIKEGEIIPGAFRERGEGDDKGMSTNWSKYSSAQELLDLAKTPPENAIVKMQVGKVRDIGSLLVKHAPLKDNRSHTNVIGIPREKKLKTKVRAKMLMIYEWAIKLN